jgi:hypothetical protein
MAISVDITTILLLFCGGIVFSLTIAILVFLVYRCLKRQSNPQQPPALVTLPSALQTGRSAASFNQSVLSSRLTSRRKHGFKFIGKKKKGVVAMNNNKFSMPGSNPNAFTVTTTLGDEEEGEYKEAVKKETQRLELEESYSKKDDSVKNIKLRLELSGVGDESLTFDGNVSNLRSPNVGKLVMMQFTKGDDLGFDGDVLEDIGAFDDTV